jgi:predicted membrane channel-forming protein YqfA (hemolysin III family)
MSKLQQALADINAIRTQVARETQFRGYGPRSIAAGGFLALAVAAAEATWQGTHESSAVVFLSVWVTTAFAAATLSAGEAFYRTRKEHEGQSKEMLRAAIEQFMPAVVVGLMLTVVLDRTAPDQAWMLPGLWQLAFCLGVFASCRFLPRPMFTVGLWYLVTGLTCLVIGSSAHELFPWSMGIPFGIGQLLIAAVLRYSYGDGFEERRA